MTYSYEPVITTTPESFQDLASLEAGIKRLGLTHVRDNSGRVHRIFSHLNRKSIPLNTISTGPSRLAFNRVESFGHFTEGN